MSLAKKGVRVCGSPFCLRAYLPRVRFCVA